MRIVKTENIYKSGFFAFLCGTVLIGVLLGAVTYCCSEGEFLHKIGLVQADFIKSRTAMDYGQIMVSSLTGTTVFLAAAFICGLCPLGQPAELAALLFRGMGLGLTLSQLYGAYGKDGILHTMGLILPGAVISTLAMIIAVREAIVLSNIYLRMSLSDRQENGLMDAIKLYAAKFLVLEAALAVAAGADCLCNYIFIGYF